MNSKRHTTQHKRIIKAKHAKSARHTEKKAKATSIHKKTSAFRHALPPKRKEAVNIRKKARSNGNAVVRGPTIEAVDARVISEALEDGIFSNYIINNIGKKSVDVLKALMTPQTDEKLAEDLAVRINEVRRILNMLNTEGIARYVVNRDNKGWLTFRWYVDGEKLEDVRTRLFQNSNVSEVATSADCNDFFYCESCYKRQKIILPFETAVEMNFRCEDGHMLKRIDKADVERLSAEEVAPVVY